MRYDPYLTAPTTAWILHHRLVSRPDSPTSWRWFFCESGLVTFTRDEFLRALSAYLMTHSQQKFSERSLLSDFQVLVRMYQSSGQEGELLLYPSVFSALGLIQKNAYQDRYRRNLNPPVPITVFLFVCVCRPPNFFPTPVFWILSYCAAASIRPFCLLA